ncbi:TPA: hypothetical protein EYP66_00205 [Candidatus Poribacteria bacterium]|nr:hypothetical protein [Candidatus Poribacteria bacterium]
MPTTEERVNRLENIMIELADAQMRTQASLKRFSDEMQDFKNEMREFKDEMREFKEEARADRKQMNKQWGELANKMGTIVEDIVAPNIPQIAKEYFGFRDIEDFMVRRQVRNKKDRAKRREFDVIAVEEKQVIINETKSTPRIDYIDAFIEVLPQIEDYFPEYAGKKIIPIFSSLYIGEDIANYLTRNQIYAMMMGEEMMELINFREVSNSL